MSDWKRARTSTTAYVETNLDDFSSEQLLQGLIDDEWLSENEAAEIKARADASRKSALTLEKRQSALVPNEAADDAWCELQRGRKEEALLIIERALGNAWLGALS